MKKITFLLTFLCLLFTYQTSSSQTLQKHRSNTLTLQEEMSNDNVNSEEVEANDSLLDLYIENNNSISKISEVAAPNITGVFIPDEVMRIGSVVTATLIVVGDLDDYTLGSGGVSGTIGGFNVGNLTRINSARYTVTFTVTDGGTDVASGDNIPVSITLTDSTGASGNTYTTPISQSNDTIDANSPTGFTVSVDQSLINSMTQDAVSYTFAGAEVGATYNYTFTSSGLGATVSDTGVIATATDQITGIDLTTLSSGTITLSITLTDISGNVSNTVTDTKTKDTTAPTSYSVTIDQSPIVLGNENAVSFTFAVAEVGATYNYTFTSDGGMGEVSGTGAIATATDQITGINLSGLPDGNITLSATLTNTTGNTGAAAINNASKDTTEPQGYSVTIDQTPIIIGTNDNVVSFTFADAEVGSTYNYTFTSDGGAGSVSDTGIIATATDQITAIDLTGLPDGLITLSVTLTDTNGYVGSPATDSQAKQQNIDVSLSSLTPPANAIDVTGNTIEVQITNTGTTSVTNVPLTVSVTSGGTSVGIANETYIGTITPGNSDTFTFVQTFDFSTDGVYDVTASTNLSNDSNAANNERTTIVANKIVLSTPLSESFESVVINGTGSFLPLTTVDAFSINGLPGWDYTNTSQGGGRLSVLQNVAIGKSLLLDNPNCDCTNNLTVNVDLSSFSLSDTDDVMLYVTVNRHGDESDIDDKIRFRTNESDPWIDIFDITTIGSVSSQNVIVNLSDVLRNNTLNFTNASQIRLSQNDNFPYSTDGASFDNVFVGKAIAASAPATVTNLPVSENVAIGSSVGKMIVDNGSGIYSVTDPNISDLFVLDPNTLEITTRADIDYEAILASNSGSNTLAYSITLTDILFGGDVTVPIEIAVSNANDAPAFASGALLFGDENQMYNYTIVLNDDDGNTVTLTSLNTLPSFLTLNPTSSPNTYLLSGNLVNQTGSYDISLQADDGNGGLTQQDFTLIAERTIRVAPLSEGFEFVDVLNVQEDRFFFEGLPGFEYDHTNAARFSIRSDFTRNGGKMMTMDNPGGESFNLVTVNLDLSAYNLTQDIRLYFSWYDHGDEGDARDVVEFRTNTNDPWIKIYDFATNSNNGSWTDVHSLDISQILSDNGLNFTNSCQLRFSQNDNFPVNTDGISIDNIFLGEVIPASAPSTMASLTVDENVAIGTSLGTITVNDGSGHFIASDSNIGDIFVINPLKLEISTRADVDYEDIIANNGGSNVFSYNITLTDEVFGGDVTIPVEITVNDLDDTPPVITATSPIDDATNADIESNITITFDENIAFGTGTIELIDLDDNSGYVAIDVEFPGSLATISGNMLTIVNPTGFLEEGTNFAVHISPTAITDNLGNAYTGIADDTTFNFTTEAAPTISIGDATVTEGDSGTVNATFTISLDKTSPKTITLDYTTSDNTATTSGNDYVGVSTTTLTFNPSETSKNVTITVNGDILDEDNEIFNIDGTNPTNASFADNQGVGTITDDDVSPTVTLSANNTSIDEGSGTTILTATLSAISGRDVTVDLSYSGTAINGTDYNSTASTSIIVSAGSLSANATVIITPVDDSDAELDETIIVDITGVTNGTENGTQQETITIIDNDAPEVTAVSVPTDAIYGINQNLDFTVTFSKAVNISGSPSIPITVGSATVQAILNGAVSNATTASFRYTVSEGDLDADGITVGSDINLNGGTILGANNIAAILTLNNIGSTANVNVEGVRPTVVITSDAGNPATVAFTTTFTFSEDVTGFDVSDITINDGAASAFTTISATVYTALITPSVDGIITIDVVANSAQDAVGNGNSAATQLSVNYDGTPPNPPQVTHISDYSCTGDVTVTGDNTLMISGTAERGSTVEVFIEGASIGTTIASNSGFFTYDHTNVTLADGTYSFTAQATDVANNTSTLSNPLTITIDSLDTDNDGIPDVCDDDKDGNGVTDAEEDCDGDGIVDHLDTDNSSCASGITQVKTYGFSPNGDGINEGWVIEDITAFPNSLVQVFNRSGKLVFKKKGYQNDWTGASNQISSGGLGTKLPVGPYLFIIDLGDGSKPTRGWLYINY